jgi:hypothetical protein
LIVFFTASFPFRKGGLGNFSKLELGPIGSGNGRAGEFRIPVVREEKV